MPADENETQQVLALARRLAREAGAIQRERYEADHQIDTKSAAVDLVTEVDHACEELVVSALERERPKDAILAEEGRGSDHPGARWRWIIDPLDGTTNYAHSYPRFCVSLGVACAGSPQVGVVYDPLLDELYHATAGGGAYRNDRPIRVSPEARLDRSLLATGFAYDRRQSEEDNVAEFATFLRQARALRRDGSAALDLCYVACGRLDGYWEFKLQPWDVAAGALIVTEAGGRISDLDGGDGYRTGEQVVTSNGAIHDAMIAVLREHREGS